MKCANEGYLGFVGWRGSRAKVPSSHDTYARLRQSWYKGTAIPSSAPFIASKVMVLNHPLGSWYDSRRQHAESASGPKNAVHQKWKPEPIHPLTFPSGLPVGPLSVSIFTILLPGLPSDIYYSLGGDHVYMICLSTHQPINLHPSYTSFHTPAHHEPSRSMTNPLSTPPSLSLASRLSSLEGRHR